VNWEVNGELNQFHGVGAHWLVGWFHGLVPWKPWKLLKFGVFHELFDQLFPDDHGVEFQPWFHEGFELLVPWKPWNPLKFWNPGNVLKPLNANGVLNMCVSF